MGFFVRKRVRIAPGVTLNLGKKSASVRVGIKGAGVTVGARKTRVTVGLPGTGLGWSEELGGETNRPRDAAETSVGSPKIKSQRRNYLGIFALGAGIGLGFALLAFGAGAGWPLVLPTLGGGLAALWIGGAFG